MSKGMGRRLVAGLFGVRSYPKSGNTWVRSLAQALRTGHPPDINRLGAEGHASDDLMRGLGFVGVGY